MQKSNKLRFKQLAAPLAGLALIGLTSPVVNAADGEIEEVIITGSYIKGSPTDSASPVDIMDQSYINSTGALSVGELVSKLTISSGAENQSDSFTQGSSQGTSNINLRGLGLSSTLVLINGKRQTISGATANDGSVFVDTNTIPVIAIERVEVLKEGAATAYGSDAVAGVANFILLKDFEGFEIRGAFSSTAEDSQEDSNISMMWGAGNDTTHFNIALEYFDRTALSSSDRPDLVDNAISTLGTTFLPLPGVVDGVPLTVTVPSGAYAGTYTHGENVPDPSCVENSGTLIPQASGARCGFHYGPRFNLVNEETRTLVYASLTHDFNDELSFSAEVNYADDEIKDNPQSPSYPILSFPVIGADHPGNPFGVAALWLGRPLGSAFASPDAPRDNTTIRVMGELSGIYNDSTDWSVSLTYSENEFSYFTPDILNSRLVAALAGTGGVNGDEYFNPFDPTGNDASIISWLQDNGNAGEGVTRTADLLVLDAIVSGDWFDLSSGTVQYAAGFQARNEGYQVERNDYSLTSTDSDGVLQAADLTFLGGGTESNSDRDAYAAFVEVLFPLSDSFELTTAVRYEKLENDSSVDPKISARWTVSDTVTLRASASTSFRQPSLSQLNDSATSLVGVADTDAVTGDVSPTTNFIRVTSAGSADLKPEESENYNIGVIWQPTDEFDARLDYWRIDYSDVIQSESAQGLVIADRCGPQIIRQGDCATGNLVGVTSGLFNAATVETDGIDLEATYRLETDGLGSFAIRANVAYVLSYEIPTADGGTEDVVGLFNFASFARSLPETKINTSINWDKENHSAAAIIYYVSSYETTRAVPAGESQNIDSWVTLDLQYGYRFDLDNSAEANLTFGIKNATDEEPPRVYDSANLSYDPKQHDPRGRIYYVNAAYRF